MNYFWFSHKQAKVGCPNTISVHGERVAYTEWTEGAKPGGTWDDYIFVHKCEDWPEELKINDSFWMLHLPLRAKIQQLKEKKMSKTKELKISKEKVLQCAGECEEFKAIAQKLWPDEFKEREKRREIQVEDLEIVDTGDSLVVREKGHTYWLFRLGVGSYTISGCEIEKDIEGDVEKIFIND
jgi:hypothetical protein